MRKTKKLLVFENEFDHAYENYKNYENCAGCHSQVAISFSLSMV
jgi:hypothetical protein